MHEISTPLSRPDFLHKDSAVVIITTREKVGKMLKAVASFYVNQKCISTTHARCGKLLWKSLWRMWKTLGYQQVFRTFGFSRSMWRSPHTGLHNSGYNPVTGALRHRIYPAFTARIRVKKFSSLKKMLSKPVSPPPPPEIFCEKSPKIRSVSFSSRWKYFSYHVFYGGTRCREK